MVSQKTMPASQKAGSGSVSESARSGNFVSLPERYVPDSLTMADKIKQVLGLNASRKAYKKGIYKERKIVKSFKSKPSKHVAKALAMYKVDSIKPSPALAKASGCKLKTLKKIVNKGEGAFYSSGSRPNQTAQSWGHARLASALTSGNAAIVDFNEIKNGCNHNGRAYKLALVAVSRKPKVFLRATRRGKPKPRHVQAK
jgi:hypothetical protein